MSADSSARPPLWNTSTTAAVSALGSFQRETVESDG